MVLDSKLRPDPIYSIGAGVLTLIDISSDKIKTSEGVEKIIYRTGGSGGLLYQSESVESIYLPSTLTYISTIGSPYGSYNLKNVYYNGTQEDWEKIEIANQLFYNNEALYCNNTLIAEISSEKQEDYHYKGADLSIS